MNTIYAKYNMYHNSIDIFIHLPDICYALTVIRQRMD